MLALGLLLVGALGGVVTELRVEPREPLALIVSTPTPDAARVRASELIDLVASRLERSTAYRGVVLDPSFVRECRGRLACLAERVRVDNSGARWLLVVTQLTRSGEPDRVSATLLDLRLARVGAEEPSPDLDAELNDRAVKAARVSLADVDAADEAVEGWFRGPFAEVLAMEAPFAQLRLQGVDRACSVSVDGQVIGTASGPEILLRDLQAGPHVVALVAADGVAFRETVELAPGARGEVGVQFASDGPGRELSWGLGIGGATAVLAGAGFLALAIAQHDGAVRTFCFRGTPDCSSGNALETFGFAGQPAIGVANPAGLTPVAVGTSLAALGATWLASALWSDGEPPLWIGLGAGVLVGAATLGIVSAAAGPHPGSAP